MRERWFTNRTLHVHEALTDGHSHSSGQSCIPDGTLKDMKTGESIFSKPNEQIYCLAGKFLAPASIPPSRLVRTDS